MEANVYEVWKRETNVEKLSEIYEQARKETGTKHIRVVTASKAKAKLLRKYAGRQPEKFETWKDEYGSYHIKVIFKK